MMSDGELKKRIWEFLDRTTNDELTVIAEGKTIKYLDIVRWQAEEMLQKILDEAKKDYWNRRKYETINKKLGFSMGQRLNKDQTIKILQYLENQNGEWVNKWFGVRQK